MAEWGRKATLLGIGALLGGLVVAAVLQRDGAPARPAAEAVALPPGWTLDPPPAPVAHASTAPGWAGDAADTREQHFKLEQQATEKAHQDVVRDREASYQSRRDEAPLKH